LGGWGVVVVYLELGADLHMVQLMPLPLTVPCFSKIQIAFWYRFTRVVPEKRAVKRVCVCVCVCVCSSSSRKYMFACRKLTWNARWSRLSTVSC